MGWKPLVVSGLVLQATGLTWLALLVTPNTPYVDMVVPFVVSGLGMTLFFVPLASLVLSAVPTALEGIASGANSAFRELGGVLGIAVLGAVFSAHGGYSSGASYVAGMTPTVYVGAAVVALGAVSALIIPGRRAARRSSVGSPPVAVTAPAGRAQPEWLVQQPALSAAAVTAAPATHGQAGREAACVSA